MDMRTGDVRWRRRFKTPINSAALTTDGGVVFAGSWDRHMYAFDVDTGDTLWQTRLPTSVQGFPITYAVDGRQYLAVPGRQRRRQLGRHDPERPDAGGAPSRRRQRRVRLRSS